MVTAKVEIMDRSALYDEDLFLWSQHQALALRRLASTQRDLPNDLDLEHIAEEIEDVGGAELRSVESFLRRVLEHAIKLASAPGSPAGAGWLGEMLTWQRDALAHYTPGMHQKIDLQRVWRLAVSDARAKLRMHGEERLPLPRECPIDLQTLLTEEFDPHALAVELEGVSRQFVSSSPRN